MGSAPHGFINSKISNFWTILFTQQVDTRPVYDCFVFCRCKFLSKKQTRLVLIGPNLPENSEFEICEIMW